MPVPWESQGSPAAPTTSGVPWEQDLKNAYPVAGNTFDYNQFKKQPSAADYYEEQRKRLASNKNIRRQELGKITTPEELATAYGFKPGELSPEQLTDAFNSFLSKGYQYPEQQKRGALGSFFENLGSTFAAPISKAKQFYTHGRAAITGSPEDIQTRNANDLAVKMYEEERATSTEGHPVASFAGTAVGGTPWAMMGPSATLGGSIGTGFALGAMTPQVDNGNILWDALKQGTIGGVGGGLGYGLIAKPFIAGGTKLGPLVTGNLPAEAKAAQNQVLSALPGLSPTDISAANLNFRGGVQKTTGPLAGFKRIVSGLGGDAASNEKALGETNRVMEDLLSGAKSEAASTPFGFTQQLEAAAAGGDANARRILGLMPHGPAAPVGATQQGSLSAEQFGRDITHIQPAYAAVPPQPASTGPLNVAPLSDYLTTSLGTLQGKGGTSPYKPLTAFLEQTGKDLSGEMSPEFLAFQKTMAGQPPHIQAQILSSGKAPTKFKTPPMDDIEGLMTLRDNLDHQRRLITAKAPDKMGGSETSHYLTEAIDRIDSILGPAQATPEWQAHLAAKQNAANTFATYGSVYKKPLVSNLVQDELHTPISPDVTSDAIRGMKPSQVETVVGAMEPRGQAATRADLIQGLIDRASTPTAPKGLQISRAGLLGEIPGHNILAVGTPEQTQALTNLRKALETLSDVDLAHAGTGLNAASAAAAPFSVYQAAKTAIQTIPGIGHWLLTNPNTKAALLTLSATRDPALRGTMIQKILQTVEYEMSNTAGLPFARSMDNPTLKQQ